MKKRCPNCDSIMVVKEELGLMECLLCGYAEELNGKEHDTKYIR
jgi:DNA-directed RNA polymerase subunit M/transcription elongation factor TFIIS